MPPPGSAEPQLGAAVADAFLPALRSPRAKPGSLRQGYGKLAGGASHREAAATGFWHPQNPRPGAGAGNRESRIAVERRERPSAAPPGFGILMTIRFP